MRGRREVHIDHWNLASSSSSDDGENASARRAIEEGEDEVAVDHQVHLESLHPPSPAKQDAGEGGEADRRREAAA